MDTYWWKYGISAASLVLIISSFFFGIYIGEERIPAVERVTGLINKDRDPLSLGATAGQEVDFAPFWRVWNTLETKYVPRSTSSEDVVDPQDKVWSAILGLVDTYDDPYTVFLPPKQTAEFKISTQGTFEGVGMVVGMENDQLVVVAPLEGSPAMKAGLQEGDKILSINGEVTAGVPIDVAVGKIRGPKGSTVALTIGRNGESEKLEIPVVRGNIEIPSTNTSVVTRQVPKQRSSVTTANEQTPLTTEIGSEGETTSQIKTEETETQDFFVLRLFSFSQTSIKAFERGLEEFEESGTNKLIIDLRNNPGGFLEAAVNIASYFLPQGSIVVREIVGADKSEREHRSVGYTLLQDKLDNLKIAVLVNRGSASASEILAGALQEYNVATLIGEKTFGKGSVQELIEIDKDTSLKVTIARWFTPNGISISSTGLIPDIVVDLKREEGVEVSTDPFLDAAIQYLAGDEIDVDE